MTELETAGRDDDRPAYTDPDTLRRKYHDEEKSLSEIADEYDVNHNTIRDWMDKHGIERRERHGGRQPEYTDEEVVDFVRERSPEPIIVNDMARALDIDPRTARRYLRNLDTPHVKTKRTAASSNVWWYDESDREPIEATLADLAPYEDNTAYDHEDALELLRDRAPEPLTTTDVGMVLGLSHHATHVMLSDLNDDPEIGTKRTGARGRVWWHAGEERDE